jgi:hypothetical protein
MHVKNKELGFILLILLPEGVAGPLLDRLWLLQEEGGVLPTILSCRTAVLIPAVQSPSGN